MLKTLVLRILLDIHGDSTDHPNYLEDLWVWYVSFSPGRSLIIVYDSGVGSSTRYMWYRLRLVDINRGCNVVIDYI